MKNLTLPLFLAGLLIFSLSPSYADDNNSGYSQKYKQLEPPAEQIPKYFSMDKNVVNLRNTKKAKFLAVDFKFMSYYPQLVEVEMEHLRPILKNDIDRLLRNQSYENLSTPDGPDILREEILNVARQILEEHKLYPNLLEDVYLDRYVIQ